MKKSFLLAAALTVMSVLGLPGAVAANTADDLDWQEVDGIWYLLNHKDKTATVTYGPATGEPGLWSGIGSNTYNGHLNIPETISYSNGETYSTYTVTAVGDHAFAWNSGLTQVTIPATVKSLGTLLFQRTSSCTYLHIADSREPLLLNQMEDESVTYTALDDGGQMITTLYLGRDLAINSTASYPMPPFHAWTSLTQLIIGRNVTTLTDGFMQMCRNLESIQVNTPRVLAAGNGMFMMVENKESINLYVPEGLGEAYGNTDGWKDFNIREMDFEQQNLVQFAEGYWDVCVNGLFLKRIDPDDASKGMRVVRAQVWYLNPDGTKIDPSHTSQWPYQQSVIDIPAEVTFEGVRYAVTAISDYCFRDAKNLEQLTIPTSVTEVGASIMDGTPRLKKVVIPESVTKIGWLAFCRSGIEEVWIPASSNNWNESGAFQESHNLRTVHFANGITKIGDSMFRGCDALQTLTIPDGVTGIGNGAFSGCTGLSEIHLPAALDVIFPRMFYGCPLRKLEIPAGVKTIFSGAFAGTALTQLNVKEGNTFYDSRNNCNAVIETKTNILVNGCNGTFIPETVDTIAISAFNEIKGLRSITLPKNLKKIQQRAFYNNPDLSIITSLIEQPAGVLAEGAFINEYFDGNENVVTSPLETATLYVPAGTKEAYMADAVWSKAKNIIEMAGADKPADVADLKPVSVDGTADFSKMEGKDLSNAVVDNMYITCDKENGDNYDKTEQALVLNTVVDELMMQNILANEGNMDILRNLFSGIVIEIPAGKGTIKIEAKVTGERALSVVISGMSGAMTFNPAAKTELEIPYDVAKKALVYIYGIYAHAAAPAPQRVPSKILRTPKAAEDANLVNNISIYGAKWIVSEVTTGTEEVEGQKSKVESSKVLRDGQVLIIRDGKTYNMFGTEVK
ncbi:MAG: leucine-rich repeat protein [Paludibacteraceae bacterium]|nr:leucine-rich repeat protein [Paludibacteraceae bacterium]